MRTAGRAARVAVTLARLEHRQWAAALHPGLWRRGFLSSRHYLYPELDDSGLPYISDVAVEARLGRINPSRVQALTRDKVAFVEALAARDLANRAPHSYGVIRDKRFEGEGDLAALREVVLKPIKGRVDRGLVLHEAIVRRAVGGSWRVTSWARSGCKLISTHWLSTRRQSSFLRSRRPNRWDGTCAWRQGGP